MTLVSPALRFTSFHARQGRQAVNHTQSKPDAENRAKVCLPKISGISSFPSISISPSPLVLQQPKVQSRKRKSRLRGGQTPILFLESEYTTQKHRLLYYRRPSPALKRSAKRPRAFANPQPRCPASPVWKWHLFLHRARKQPPL